MSKQLNMEAYRSGHNEAVLKTVWVQAHGGSNPSASAKRYPTEHPVQLGIFLRDFEE